MTDYISREAAIKRFNFAVLDCLGMEPTIRAGDIIKALESIPAADVRPVKWIPVTERLPEEYVNVLCHFRSLDRQSEYYSIDHLMEDGQWWKASTSWKHEVTHWMPLPEPPKEET